MVHWSGLNLVEKGGRLEAIQDDNQADQKMIDLEQSGPDRADWKKTILGEMGALMRMISAVTLQ